MSSLRLKNLSLDIGDKRLLNDISLDFNEGQMHAIVGPNGSGKSSLLKCLCLLHQASEGDVLIDDENIRSWSDAKRASSIAYLGQFTHSHWRLNAEQIIELGLIAAPHLSAAEKVDRVTELIEQFDLNPIAQQDFNTLSGGERARVLLARAVSAKPRFLLVDEPLSGLDLKYQSKILNTLKTLADSGVSIIIVLHDLNQALQYCQTCSLIHGGNLIQHGTADEVLSLENIKKYFEVDLNHIKLSNGQRLFVDHAYGEAKKTTFEK